MLLRKSRSRKRSGAAVVEFADQGFLFFQDRTANVPVNVTGNGALTVKGTFYAAAATLNVTGNGTTDVIGSQYISRSLVTGGNGSFSVNWTAADTPGVRQLLLVE